MGAARSLLLLLLGAFILGGAPAEITSPRCLLQVTRSISIGRLATEELRSSGGNASEQQARAAAGQVLQQPSLEDGLQDEVFAGEAQSAELLEGGPGPPWDIQQQLGEAPAPDQQLQALGVEDQTVGFQRRRHDHEGREAGRQDFGAEDGTGTAGQPNATQQPPPPSQPNATAGPKQQKQPSSAAAGQQNATQAQAGQQNATQQPSLPQQNATAQQTHQGQEASASTGQQNASQAQAGQQNASQQPSLPQQNATAQQTQHQGLNASAPAGPQNPTQTPAGQQNTAQQPSLPQQNATAQQTRQGQEASATAGQQNASQAQADQRNATQQPSLPQQNATAQQTQPQGQNASAPAGPQNPTQTPAGQQNASQQPSLPQQNATAQQTQHQGQNASAPAGPQNPTQTPAGQQNATQQPSLPQQNATAQQKQSSAAQEADATAGQQNATQAPVGQSNTTQQQPSQPQQNETGQRKQQRHKTNETMVQENATQTSAGQQNATEQTPSHPQQNGTAHKKQRKKQESNGTAQPPAGQQNATQQQQPAPPQQNGTAHKKQQKQKANGTAQPPAGQQNATQQQQPAPPQQNGTAPKKQQKQQSSVAGGEQNTSQAPAGQQNATQEQPAPPQQNGTAPKKQQKQQSSATAGQQNTSQAPAGQPNATQQPAPPAEQTNGTAQPEQGEHRANETAGQQNATQPPPGQQNATQQRKQQRQKANATGGQQNATQAPAGRPNATQQPAPPQQNGTAQKRQRKQRKQKANATAGQPNATQAPAGQPNTTQQPAPPQQNGTAQKKQQKKQKQRKQNPDATAGQPNATQAPTKQQNATQQPSAPQHNKTGPHKPPQQHQGNATAGQQNKTQQQPTGQQNATQGPSNPQQNTTGQHSHQHQQKGNKTTEHHNNTQQPPHKQQQQNKTGSTKGNHNTTGSNGTNGTAVVVPVGQQQGAGQQGSGASTSTPKPTPPKVHHSSKWNQSASWNRSLSKSTPAPDGQLASGETSETSETNATTKTRRKMRTKKNKDGTETVEEVPEWHSWAVLFVMLVMLVLLFHETFPPFIILLTALAVVWNLGIVTSNDAIKGFSNQALVTVAALFVVVKGVDRPGLISKAAKMCLGSQSTEKTALVRFNLFIFFVGGFMNNTPLVALMMPILRDWARSRDFAPSKFLMPMAYSSICGGYICMMGASTHLMVNGMMEEATGETFGFFAPLPLGALGALFGLWYLFTLGVKLLPDHRGGLFRTLKEKTSDMVTEVQVMHECPLVGVNIWEALDRLGIPRGALLKVVRQPPVPGATPARRNFLPPGLARATSEGTMPGPAFGFSPAGSTSGALQRAETRTVRSTSPDVYRGPRAGRRLQTGRAESESDKDETPGSVTYGDRTREFWGTFPRASRRRRAATDSMASPRSRAIRLNKKNGLEIFPVPEHEVLEGGDVLFLSLPQQDCIALVGSQHVNGLLQDMTVAQRGSAIEEAAELENDDPGGESEGRDVTKSLRICDVDLLEVPGRESEFIELVVSRTNPFIGKALEGPVRREFEKHYQVCILATRNNWTETTNEQLASRVYSRQEEFKKVVLSGDSSELEADEKALRELRQPPLGPGDTVLVLTRLDDFERNASGRDFLATTAVASKPEDNAALLDYVPMVLFVAVLVLVNMGHVTMVQGMVSLMVVYVAGGWVMPSEISNCIDWHMLILIGSALGMATAVQASGLSTRAAIGVESMKLGKHGTVFVLFLFTMLLAEMVTNSAAAALGFPLALDLSNELGMESVKPLAMTVMLASATAFASPISSPATLMVLGPGGYSFLDFLKVGIALDIIYWLMCSTMLPVFFPL